MNVENKKLLVWCHYGGFMITKEADYAIRTVLFLSSNEDEELRSTAEMAEQMFIPYRFLRKIVRKLAAAGIVKSIRGKGGGIVLVRPKETISLLEILELFDPKSVRLNSCHVKDADCPRIDVCTMHSQMAKVQQLTNSQLAEITFDKLI